MQVMRKIISGLMVIGLWGCWGVSQAGALDELRAFSKNRQFAQGRFEQQVVSESGKVKEKSQGQFAFSKPGRFMWNVQKPYPQLLVANGKQVISYDEDLAQASVRPLGQAIDSSPAALLFGNQSLDNLFVMTEVGQEGGKQWLQAVPKTEETLFESIRIGMQGGLPVEMHVRDAMGQVTRLKLLDWKFDSRKPDAFFEFKVPPGVDVIQAK